MRRQSVFLAISMCLAQCAMAVEVIQRGADGTEYGATEEAWQLWGAVQHNDLQRVVKKLVTEKSVGTYINEENLVLGMPRESTVLHLAAREDNRYAAELLIQKGASVNARDDTQRTPLYMAAMSNSREVAELLIKNGASVDARDYRRRTPLHDAARTNSREMAELLTEKGVSVDARDAWQQTALHVAATWNSREVAELLIENGASVDARDYRRQTPLHDAARTNSREMAELLTEKGALVDARNHFQRTPLHIAAWENSRGGAELLIENGASVDARDKLQRTPLYMAAMGGCRDVAELLIAAGAQLNEQDDHGRVPADYARFAEVATLFNMVLPQLTQEDIATQVLHSLSEAEKVSYAKMAFGQGSDQNARRIIRALEHDASRAEVALHMIMLQLGSAAYRDRARSWLPSQLVHEVKSMRVRRGEMKEGVTVLQSLFMMQSHITMNKALRIDRWADQLAALRHEFLADANVYAALPHAVVHRVRNSRISASLLRHVCYRAKDAMAQYRDEHGNTLLHEMARQGVSTGCSYLLAAIRDYYFQNPHAENDINERLRCIVQNADEETPLMHQLKNANEYQPLSCSLRYEDEGALLDYVLSNNFGRTPRDIAHENTGRGNRDHRYHTFMQVYDEALATCIRQNSLYDTLKREQSEALLSDMDIILKSGNE